MWLTFALAMPALAVSPQDLSAALERFDAHAIMPLPPLDQRDLQRLVDGDVVRIIDREEANGGPARVVGMVVLDHSRAAVWLALQDPHFAGSDGLVEELIAQLGPDRARWLGYLDIPKPFADRQWALDVWNEHSVAVATDGEAWEHPWQLAPEGIAQVRPRVAAGKVPGLTVDQLDSAVTTPINQGAWVAIELGPNQTLVAYHGRFDLGGGIPDGLVNRYLLSTLPNVFSGVEQRAGQEVTDHYTESHEPILGGDGRVLPHYGPIASTASPSDE